MLTINFLDSKDQERDSIFLMITIQNRQIMDIQETLADCSSTDESLIINHLKETGD